MAANRFRIEKDSLGEVKVPKGALWGAQTQRAVNNFPVSGIKMDLPFTKSFVSSLGIIKDAAARANLRLKLLPAKRLRLFQKLLKKYGKKNITKNFQLMYFKPVQVQALI